MWHDHDIDSARWLHPAIWHVALGWHAAEFARWQHPAMWHVALGSWHWIRQVATPCSVAGGSGITCHRIRPNVHHIGNLHLVSILTISPQSTCHCAPEFISKSDHPQQKTRGQSNLTKRASRGPIPRLGVTPGGRNLYHWIPGVGFPISVP